MATHSRLSSLSRRDLLKAGGALIVSFALRPRCHVDARQRAAARPISASRSTRTKSTASWRSTPTAPSPSTPARSMSAPGCASPLRRWPPRSWAFRSSASRSSKATQRLCPDQGGTGGSTGLTRGGAGVRRAAATARQALLDAGRRATRPPAASLTIVDGQVRPTAGGAGVGIGALIGGKPPRRCKVDPKAPLTAPARYTVVGKPIPAPRRARQVPPDGTSTCRTSRLPGMLHGRVIRPPAIGAKLLSVDEAPCSGIPDVRVVRIENFLGVVAKDEWAAVRAARRSRRHGARGRALPGSDGARTLPATRRRSIATRRSSAAATRRRRWPARRRSSPRPTTGRTRATHRSARRAPSPTCARMAADDLVGVARNVWPARRNLAKMFGMPVDKMRVVFPGRLRFLRQQRQRRRRPPTRCCSREPSAQPVRVQWMRQDEHGWDPKGPPQLLDMRGGLDAQGRIVAWDTQMWVPTTRIAGRPAAAGGGRRRHCAGAWSERRRHHAERRSAVRRAERARRGALAEGHAAARRRTCARRAKSPTCSRWRASPTSSRPPRAWIRVEFRLRGLTDPRAIDVIDARARDDRLAAAAVAQSAGARRAIC